MVIPAPPAHRQAHRHLLQDWLTILVHTDLSLLHRCLPIVFRSVEHRLPHEFTVLQHLSSSVHGVVVPIHYQRLVRGIHRVIIEESAHREASAAQLSLQLRIAAQKLCIADKLRGKEIFRVLDVPDPRLPEQVQQVHSADGNIPQSPQLSRIPENAIGGAPAFQLVPPGI